MGLELSWDERRVRNAEVEGSIPFRSTKDREKDVKSFSLSFMNLGD